MTEQETFDMAARPLLHQGCKSEKYGMSVYRGSNGSKCVIGFLIPDDRYDPEMEGRGCLDAIVSEVLKSLGHDLELCLSLQAVHDIGEVSEWEDRLRGIAKDYGLSDNVLTKSVK